MWLQDKPVGYYLELSPIHIIHHWGQLIISVQQKHSHFTIIHCFRRILRQDVSPPVEICLGLAC